MGKFKIITAESYFQPSIPPGLMVAEGDYVRPATLLDFLQPLDAIQLGDGVPGEVADLFEVAKGAMRLQLSLLAAVHRGGALRTPRLLAAESSSSCRSAVGPSPPRSQ